MPQLTLTEPNPRLPIVNQLTTQHPARSDNECVQLLSISWSVMPRQSADNQRNFLAIAKSSLDGAP